DDIEASSFWDAGLPLIRIRRFSLPIVLIVPDDKSTINSDICKPAITCYNRQNEKYIFAKRKVHFLRFFVHAFKRYSNAFQMAKINPSNFRCLRDFSLS
ncbi:MAG: hypothetical protein NC301_09220, partial [Bacteroides sp.]|nr:hypothetical protein [Bacteroides sp.]